MKSEIVKSDFNGLNEFIKGLQSGFVVDVGIMGNKAGRKDEKGLTNADVGFVHEFGTSKIPKRSFLRMPIFLHAEEILEQVKKAGALKKLAAGKMVEVLADIGIACEATILQAFASSGWGSWAANHPSTIKRKGSSSPLIDTGQLRRSISSHVTTP